MQSIGCPCIGHLQIELLQFAVCGPTLEFGLAAAAEYGLVGAPSLPTQNVLLVGSAIAVSLLLGQVQGVGTKHVLPLFYFAPCLVEVLRAD